MKQIKKAWLFLLAATVIMSVGCGKESNGTLVSEKETPAIEESNNIDQSKGKEQEEITETLPIGTIVRVEGMEGEYMVTVHDYIVPEVPDKTWQYAACAYPQGNVSSVPALVFNNEDIEEVIAKGLESMESAAQVEYEVKEGYLPIGTVVHVEGADFPLMIIGRMQQLSGSDKVYDYAAAEYPAGNVDPTQNYLFDKDIIDTIYFLGYSDEKEIRKCFYL